MCVDNVDSCCGLIQLVCVGNVESCYVLFQLFCVVKRDKCCGLFQAVCVVGYESYVYYGAVWYSGTPENTGV